MKLTLFSNFVAIVVLGFVGLLICFLGNSLVTMADPTDLTRSISEFSSQLYTTAIEGKSSNIIISPFSVHMALSLAYMGAGGITAQEMRSGLKLENSGRKEQVAQAVQNILDPLQNNTMLKVANKVYVMKNYVVKPEFDEIARKNFHSESQTLDFSRATESAREINTWVEDRTNNKIKDLIKADALGADTRMVLVNAIYFKGFWEHQFKKERTRKEKFYTSETDFVEVDMMHVKAHFRYGELSAYNAKAIELPYKDSDMAMFIVLPNKKDGLAKLERDLANVDIHDLSKNLYKTEVEVTLPKFKIEFEVSLVEALRKMNMGTMFSDSADFSDLLQSREDLHISDVIHKAFIDVNEEGAEAAAATGVVLLGRSARVNRAITFTADRGFIYVLTSKSAGIIFIGRKRQ